MSEATPEDRIAYSQMHKVFELIVSMNAEEVEGGDKNESKTNSKINKFKIDVREEKLQNVGDKTFSTKWQLTHLLTSSITLTFGNV